ncbi:MAG: sugar transferase [Armatimonadetes bacterium]|nr:sugar transferase [Armatimonadota bacterium]
MIPAANALTTSAYPPGYASAKRVLDTLGAGIGLLLLFPLFAVIAILIAMDSPGPIFHRRRVLAKQPFTPGDVPQTFDAFKFRTMIPDADDWLVRNPAIWAQYQVEFKLKDDPRITKVGNWLRRTSLDELPQLINVLCGQMSLVGPRMITPAELQHYAPFESKLMAVLPGLTGFWQVSGRSNVSYPERVRLDMWYIDNRSLRLDLEILWRTVGTVILRRGAH